MKPKDSKRKREIFAVAAQLFREKGYAATSVRDIADAVGLEPSSLYSHIKSKEEILIRICEECAQLFSDGMNTITSQDKSPIEMLDQLIDLHVEIAYSRPSSVTVFNDEWRHLPQHHLTPFLLNRKDYEERFRSILQKGMDIGLFAPLSTNTAFNIIINSVKWLHFYTHRLTQEAYDKKHQEIKSFIHRGLVVDQ